MTAPSAEEQERAIVAELRELGYDVDSAYALRERYRSYPDAVPVLTRWLPRVTDLSLKETLLRNLAVRSAKKALGAVIDEFRSAAGLEGDQGYYVRWAAGNTIEVLWDDAYFDQLRDIATDRGVTGREMVVRGLARSKHPEAPDVLLELLDDPDPGARNAAIVALRKRPHPDARARLEALRPAVERWLQKDIDKTLATLPPP